MKVRPRPEPDRRRPDRRRARRRLAGEARSARTAGAARPGESCAWLIACGPSVSDLVMSEQSRQKIRSRAMAACPPSGALGRRQNFSADIEHDLKNCRVFCCPSQCARPYPIEGTARLATFFDGFFTAVRLAPVGIIFLDHGRVVLARGSRQDRRRVLETTCEALPSYRQRFATPPNCETICGCRGSHTKARPACWSRKGILERLHIIIP